jgi:ribosomal protein S18 acetylase RimI-like enzyme
MTIRLYQAQDLAAVVRLSAACARAEADFVLNPMWETEEEFHAEFERHAIQPQEHLLVKDAGEGEVLGLSGFLRPYGAHAAGMFCPIVERGERGRGLGGELLRAGLDHGLRNLGLELTTAGIGTRNRAGYSLLTAHGFRSVRQHFLMRCDAKPADGRAPLAKLELAHAQPDDVPVIHEIYESCGFQHRTPEEMQAVFSDGRHAHTVARHEGTLVAFTELETHWPKRNWVAFVGVRKELRDRGVGSSLVSWAVAQQFELGAESALLMLSPANRTAVRAYEKVGFRRVRLFDVLEKAL